MNDNITLFQFFHWYIAREENLWQKAATEAGHLSKLGITHVWLPPAYKSAYGDYEPGYAVYDLYDLGEFDQKGSVRTKYGTKDEYLACIKAFHENNIQVLADIVLNHKLGGDEKEEFPVRKVWHDNRTEMAEEEKQYEGWTKFYFPGRNGKYSDYHWDWHSFTGISDDPSNIYLILNEHADGKWDDMLEEELGNYDYLMGNDIEFRNQNVVEELKKWGVWYVEMTGIDGFRLDAIKHISHQFYNEWLDHMRDHFKRDFLCIGEYWRSNADMLIRYLEATNERVQLFDVPLHFNFHIASTSDSSYDMRQILDNSLLVNNPWHAITFVDNHDTQPLQSLQSPVEEWFQPHCYAIILLREQGLPCVFYAAFYGAKYSDHNSGNEYTIELSPVANLVDMIRIRRELAYGIQRDYFDHGNTIGFTREGIDDREHSGLAVVITNGSSGDKTMDLGKRHAGGQFVDITGRCQDKVTVNEEGIGQFFVTDRSVSIWIREEAVKKIKANE